MKSAFLKERFHAILLIQDFLSSTVFGMYLSGFLESKKL